MFAAVSLERVEPEDRSRGIWDVYVVAEVELGIGIDAALPLPLSSERSMRLGLGVSSSSPPDVLDLLFTVDGRSSSDESSRARDRTKLRSVRVDHPFAKETAVGPVYTALYSTDARLPLKRPVMVPRSEPDDVAVREYGIPTASPGLKVDEGPRSDTGFDLCRRRFDWCGGGTLRTDAGLMVVAVEGCRVCIYRFSDTTRDASLGVCAKGLFWWTSTSPPSSLSLLSAFCLPSPPTRRLEGILSPWSSILCAAGRSMENDPAGSSNTGRLDGSADESEPGRKICEAD